MTTQRARRPKASDSPAFSLLEALAFVIPAQSKKGAPDQTYCVIQNNWIVASNSVLTIGQPIIEDLCAKPNTYALRDALKQCVGELAITQLSPQLLAVKSGDFLATIPCAPDLPCPHAPDAAQWAISDHVRNALATVAPLLTEGASEPSYGVARLQSGSCVGTNGFALVEAWHGLDLPTVHVPEQFVKAVTRCKRELIQFGFSGESITFWYKDGSFIQTKTVDCKYPNYGHLLDCSDEFKDLPELFFNAVAKVESFSDNGIVYFSGNAVRSKELEFEATIYHIDGMPENMAFHTKNLDAVSHCMKRAHFSQSANRAWFFGPNCRGVVNGTTFYENT